MQLDAFLCQLEAWPRQRRELDLLKKEYPNIYECGTDVWELLRQSRGNKGNILEPLLAEYGKMERKFKAGITMSFIRKGAEKQPRSSETARRREPSSARAEKSDAMSPVPVGAEKSIRIAVEEEGSYIKQKLPKEGTKNPEIGRQEQ